LILQIALDTPLRRVFDYLPPAGGPPAGLQPAGQSPSGGPLLPGVRVKVPFGRRQLVGILVGLAEDSQVAAAKLKPALEILDAAPVFDAVTLDLLRWASDYYHHPIGEVFAAALPVSLRAGQAAIAPEIAGPAVAAIVTNPSDVELTEAQATVVLAITETLGQFVPHLLYGVTGSGKTEVYLRVIAEVLKRGGQALVLVPEIALTPQLVDRFSRRFSAGVAVLHSGLTGKRRRDSWRAAHSGAARVIIGTRSAVFTSLPQLALIVIDEEHDASYKQQEGFRYSARDLAVMRAQRAQVPIVLGSATPSLETLENVATLRYRKLMLPQRPGAARAPRMSLIDLTKHAGEQGLSQPVMEAIGRHLKAGGQVIVFLNRRGYAPSLYCNGCGWIAPCLHCDARMTLHRGAAQLRCHHCGARVPVPLICLSCGQPLNPVGQGTERVEETLMRLFPDAPLARLDRDTASARGAMEAVLTRVHSGEARLLVGTQMLTKGHHFAEVTLVVILDADQGLFASDFRATERLAQTITQVAGRAGRESRPGEVLIQTEFPRHPLLNRLITEGYEAFAHEALKERQEAHWPPYSRLALLRAEAKDTAVLDGFLQGAADRGRALQTATKTPAIKILGPATALIARRADHFRAHLLIEAAARATLQRFLADWLRVIENSPIPSNLRWSIDVDPLEVD
jgi:primosomal protein N' (replication factor Y)